MKYLTLGLLMVFLLCACSDQSEEGDAKIKRTELTSFEENLLSIASKHSMVYDLELKNEAAKEIVVTIDYYEKGKFVRQITEMKDLIEEDKESLRIAVLQQPSTSNEENWITSIMRKSGMSSLSFPQNTTERDKMNFASTSGGIDEGLMLIGEQKIIYSIVYTELGEMSITQDIETKEDLKKATNYEQVYIVSLEIR